MYVHKEKTNIISDKDWKEALASNQGLFKKFQKAPYIKGPFIDSTGKVQGDLLAIEINHFMNHASEEQKNYYAQLIDQDLSKAYEYILTITGSIQTWKEDMQILHATWSYLSVKEKDLEISRRRLLESLDYQKIHTLPQTIMKHIPSQYIKIDIDPSDYADLFKKIEKTINSYKDKKEVLGEYLSKKRKEMPFLFEDIRYI